MGYLTGLEQLCKPSMGFLKEIMEICGNPSQLFLHLCGLVILSWMHHCQWDKTSAFSGVFYWPVIHLQMCEGHTCGPVSMCYRSITDYSCLTKWINLFKVAMHLVLHESVMSRISFCVLGITDNNSWLETWALKGYLFVRSSMFWGLSLALGQLLSFLQEWIFAQWWV